MRIRFVNATLAAAALAAAGTALAHGTDATPVKARFGTMPRALIGVHAQVQTTVAPQMVLENDSPKMLEILDTHGRAFLRINKDGVSADIADPAWYRTETPSRGRPLPKGVADDAPPHWAKVSDQPNWGWFDPRLRTEGIKVPDAISDAGRPATLKHWAIPVRFAGQPSALSGSFNYEPLPGGVMVSRLTSSSSPAPGVSVSVAPGTVPAMFIRNDSDKPLVVMDADHRPYLRIGPGGTAANAAKAGEPVHWVTISDAPRYTWTEPRATYKDLIPPKPLRDVTHTVTVGHWSLPVTLGGKPLPVKGVVYWHPQPRLAEAEEGEHHDPH